MNYVYASLLLHSAGKPIDEEHVKKVVAATGEQPDDAKVKALISALEGKNIEEIISKAAMPVAAAPAAPAAGGDAPKAKESTEEKGKKAEEAAEGLSALFG